MSAAARRDYAHLAFISAGAGSGKTYRLTEELERALVSGDVRPQRVIGTTFTVKAAGELRERVRERLIQGGRPQLAELMAQALIGTVHSVCERLLKRFAFELGLSPELNVVSVEDSGSFFNQALDEVLSAAVVRRMNVLWHRLGFDPGQSEAPRSWRDDVKRIADTARNNDVAATDLAAMGRENADAMLAFFPPAQDGDWDDALLAAVRDALHAIDLTTDTTAKTAKYVATLRSAAYQLRRPPCPWTLWISLSKAQAAKRSEPLAAKVRAAAIAFQHHPRFHKEQRVYIESVFEIAVSALARFQALKTERGLIDFTDMEQLTLRALDEAPVRERLGAELDLLLVDEFQDTNPMQLAIFMKLAELARKVIFVGDVKQAIYAFRGCDPDLVFGALEALSARGGARDALERSWRARPQLLAYTNAVFTEAFKGELPAEHVTLQPQRAEALTEPALLRWNLAGRNLAEHSRAVADGIARLVASGFRIVDPRTGTPRPVEWGDIAVLAATNERVETIARALREAHVPMKMTLAGLLSVPEVALVRACLRRLSDRTDTLATAEIFALADASEPETWLRDRLRWLAEEPNAYAWGESGADTIAGQLAGLRAATATQSPVEVVARVLNYLGIRRAVTAWGPNAIKAAQRQRNLDAFLKLAVEYERHCDAQHVAATLTGFLFWLEAPQSPELDLQPVVTTGNAVHVLTYHKAKGLEWPVVVATDFYYPWQTRIWDVRVESTAELDIRRPLAHRVIRFWPRLFGRSSTGIAALESMLLSEEGRRCYAKCLSENRRLAYVGLTRARDALVLALPSTNVPKDAWMHAFSSRYLLPSAERLTLADGSAVDCALDDFGQASAPLAAPPFAPRWFATRAPAADRQRAIVSPSQALPIETALVEETARIGERIPVYGDDMTAIGLGLHDVITAELINPAAPGRGVARAADILRSHGAAEYVDAEDALACVARFSAWLMARFDPVRVLAEYPVTHRLDGGRVVSGRIDVLLETRAGWVVIDHKSSPRPSAEWPLEAIRHAGQLAAYRDALTAAGKPVASCWIHLPVGGAALRVR